MCLERRRTNFNYIKVPKGFVCVYGQIVLALISPGKSKLDSCQGFLGKTNTTENAERTSWQLIYEPIEEFYVMLRVARVIMSQKPR